MGLSPGKIKLTISIKEEVLKLLDQHTTPRKRAELIESLILEKYKPSNEVSEKL